MADDDASDNARAGTRSITAINRPILSTIEQAESHLRSIGVQPDDDAWQQRRALILHELEQWRRS
jgi:hypothetical protein